MRGSTMDQLRQDIDSHISDEDRQKVEDQMHAAENAAGLPSRSEAPDALWFAVGASLSAAAIAVAAAVS